MELGLGLDPLADLAERGDALARDLDHVRRDVDPGHRVPAACKQLAEPAGATADVEDLGSQPELEQLDDGRWRLRFTRALAHPPDKVWRAISEPEHLAQWFPTTIEGARRRGAQLHFAFRHGEGEPFDGEMLAFVPPSLMQLRWADDVLRFPHR